MSWSLLSPSLCTHGHGGALTVTESRMSCSLLSPSLCTHGHGGALTATESRMSCSLLSPSLCIHGHGGALTATCRRRRSTLRICATADGVEPNEEPILDFKPNPPESPLPSSSPSPSALGKDLKKVVNKTAATFAPRASTASKNPALPGTTLYTVFEVQAYASMLLGGVLSFNLLFPSNEPDIWRLMGMWSIWMFTIPSLRARDCPTKEKEALNYLFLIIPLLNVAIPFFWKSFPLVWSADTLAFFAMYAWKLGWLETTE